MIKNQNEIVDKATIDVKANTIDFSVKCTGANGNKMKSTINSGKIKYIWYGDDSNGEEESSNVSLVSSEENGNTRTYKIKGSFNNIRTYCLCDTSKLDIGDNIFEDVKDNGNNNFNTKFDYSVINSSTSISCSIGCPIDVS